MSLRPIAFRFHLASLALSAAAFTLAGSAAAQQTLPLWPHATPEPAQTTAAEVDGNVPVSTLPAGHRFNSLSNVTIPTLSVYPPPHDLHNGTAALVFPGGGYVHLSWTKEGLDTCDWLNSLGVTCLLVKYRIPEKHYPDSYADLEDAQQAIRLARAHATEWHLDPNRIGVLGFSAGGNLAALLSTHFNDDHIAGTPAAPDIPGMHGRLNGTPMLTDALPARPDFAILVYPAYLALDPGQTALDPTYSPSPQTPPTFITAAENDRTYGRNSLVYYRALLEANIPAELLFFPNGGHGFGTFPRGAPAHWTDNAAEWLRQIGMLPALPPPTPDQGPAGSQATPSTVPCPTPMPPNPGRPDPKSGQPAQPYDPNCPPPS